MSHTPDLKKTGSLSESMMTMPGAPRKEAGGKITWGKDGGPDQLLPYHVQKDLKLPEKPGRVFTEPFDIDQSKLGRLVLEGGQHRMWTRSASERLLNPLLVAEQSEATHCIKNMDRPLLGSSITPLLLSVLFGARSSQVIKLTIFRTQPARWPVAAP